MHLFCEKKKKALRAGKSKYVYSMWSQPKMEDQQTNGSLDTLYISDGVNSALSSDFMNRSKLWSVDIDSEDFAERLDKEDPLKDFRKRFHYPNKKHFREGVGHTLSNGEEECIYFCGHSLGLQLKSIENELHEVLKDWAERGVESHFKGKYPASLCDNMLKENMAYLVGAYPEEIAVMNGLTVNIHVLLSSFYQPTPERHKILMLDHGFHSDLYAVESHVRLRGYDPDESIVCLKPQAGKHLLNPKDILTFIEEEGESFALIFFEGVHFYTGQLLDMKNITRAGHKKGCMIGFDLAHSVGNVKLHLHKWNVDFGMWCTYKYLNSGAGSLGAIFVHNRHTTGDNQILPMMAGWWGITDKFSLSRKFEAAPGASRFKISNPSPFLVAMVAANLKVFKEAGVERLLEKQRLLTGYLEYLLKKNFSETNNGTSRTPFFEIITPNNPRKRGSQISLISLIPLKELEDILKAKGLVCDVRKPSAIRITPVPLYNTFTEVHRFVHTLKDIFENLSVNSSEDNK